MGLGQAVCDDPNSVNGCSSYDWIGVGGVRVGVRVRVRVGEGLGLRVRLA